MSKDEKDQRAAIVKAIVASPTASDLQVAAEVGAHHHLVADVRTEMGAKDTWPKPKEEKSK